MPLNRIQIDILTLLASKRSPESYVAGSTPLNQSASRFSKDIDIFHDKVEDLRRIVAEDAMVLEGAGYQIEWTRQLDMIHSAKVIKDGADTRLDWAVDSDYRFFPTLPNPLFGYTLHPVDLAMNKVMAAAGRQSLRDLVDLMTIHERVLSLGAVIWAAVDKAPGFTPEGLIGWIRRNSNFPRIDWELLKTTEPIDPLEFSPRLRAALKTAEKFVSQMPSSKAGLLFLESGKVVQPEPSRLDSYETHAGQRRGHWPSSPEIANAMLDHYKKGE